MSGCSLDVLKLADATRRPNSSRFDTNIKTPCGHTKVSYEEHLSFSYTFAVEQLFSTCYLVSDGLAEHHVRIHRLVHVQAHLGQFGPQYAAFDQVGLRDVRHVPETATHRHTQVNIFTSPVL